MIEKQTKRSIDASYDDFLDDNDDGRHSLMHVSICPKFKWSFQFELIAETDECQYTSIGCDVVDRQPEWDGK